MKQPLKWYAKNVVALSMRDNWHILKNIDPNHDSKTKMDTKIHAVCNKWNQTRTKYAILSKRWPPGIKCSFLFLFTLCATHLQFWKNEHTMDFHQQHFDYYVILRSMRFKLNNLQIKSNRKNNKTKTMNILYWHIQIAFG